MKRTVLVLALPLLFLAGCAQLFDTNVFKTVDNPPPLDLKNASVNDIKSLMSDPSFLERLKKNPAELKNAQQTLTDAMENGSDADKLSIGATLVDLSSNASNVSDMAAEAVENISTISDAISAGHYAKALKLFMGAQTEEEMKVTLGNLRSMAHSLALMQQAATNSNGTINSTLFFSSVSDKSSFAQSALMAGIANALVEDIGGIDDLAADLQRDSPNMDSGSNGTDLTSFLVGKGGTASTILVAGAATSTASNYSYAYIAVTMEKLPLNF